MKSPRIKLYKQIDGFNVYLVDGAKIRRDYNDQFTNFGQHYRFPKMIPVKEFWLDKDFAGEKEYDYFVDHMLKEWKMMRDGKSYNQALVAGDKVEWNERNKDEHGRYKIGILGTIGDDIKVWLVKGNLVRSDCFVDFTEGGHDLVYDFIPKNEIWIDDANSPEERPFIAVHEYDERERMSRGEPYNKAHNEASFFERHLRHSKPNLGKLEPKKKISPALMKTLGSVK